MWAAQFPDCRPTHHVFPFERCGAKGEHGSFGFTGDVIFYDVDPTQPIGDWKEAWEKAKLRAAAMLAKKAKEATSAGSVANAVNRGAERQSNRSKDAEPPSLQCRFHDLRHTAVTRLLEGGIPYPVVATIMGWSAATAIRMAKRYGHIGSKALREAADVLGQVKLPLESLKESPKSTEAENVAVQ